MNSNGDVQDLAIKIGRLLSESKKSIATAESCTGGWVGKELLGYLEVRSGMVLDLLPTQIKQN